MRKRLIIALLLTVLPGCALWQATVDVVAPAQKVVCTAHYEQIVPNVYVGSDSCGNRWLVRDGRCWYWVKDQGIVVEINCPSEGDTTYAE